MDLEDLDLNEKIEARTEKLMKNYFTAFIIFLLLSIIATVYGILYIKAVYGNILTALVSMFLFLPAIPFFILISILMILWGGTYTSFKKGIEQYEEYKYYTKKLSLIEKESPPLSDSPSVNIVFRLPKKEAEDFNDYLKKRNLVRSEVLREYILDLLKGEEEK